MSRFWRERRRESATALLLLTRLPASRLLPSDHAPAPLSACVWAFAPVGCLIGACGAVVFFAASACGFPRAVAALLTVFAQVLLTGALHEDGLADFCDSLGGRTLERRLEIMRDSRIGSYGALGLIALVGLRVGALTAAHRPIDTAYALVAAGAAGRGAMTYVLLSLTPARADGLARELAGASSPMPAIAMAALITVAALVMPTCAVAATVASASLAAWSMRQICALTLGGYTGDTLGATESVAETLTLVAMSATWPTPMG